MHHEKKEVYKPRRRKNKAATSEIDSFQLEINRLYAEIQKNTELMGVPKIFIENPGHSVIVKIDLEEEKEIFNSIEEEWGFKK